MVCFLRDSLGKLTWRGTLWILVLLWGGCGGAPPMTDTPDVVVRKAPVVAEARSPKEPLPTFSSWNTGQSGPGWRPDAQLKYLSAAPGWLPWFELYADFIPRSVEDEYYRSSWEHARQHHLPVHFVSDNFVDTFRLYKGPGHWRDAKEESEHPWIIRKNGSFVKLASPLGTKDHWFRLGKIFGRSLKPFAESYVPPYILLSDNNEAGFIRLEQLEEDYRLDPEIARMKPRPEKMRVLRQIYREGFGERYQLLKEGIESEIPHWKDRIFLMGYGAFGHKFGVVNLPSEPDRHVVPWVTATGRGKEDLTHQGVWSNTGYLTYRKHHQVASGAVESCNLFHAWHHFEKENPSFVKGQIFWQAGRKLLNQDNWLAHIRCCMWLAKPEHVAYFLSSAKSIVEGEDWFLALRAAVYEIHTDPVLRRHWLNGHLLEAPEGHPYQEMLPDAYNDPVRHRWFLLNVPLNQRFDEKGFDRWQLQRDRKLEVEIWAFVSELDLPEEGKERILFACATFSEQKNVQVEVPGVGTVALPVVPEYGDFFRISDDGSVERHHSPLDEVDWN